MVVIREHIKSEDVLNIINSHKRDLGKRKCMTELYNEILNKLIIEKVGE